MKNVFSYFSNPDNKPNRYTVLGTLLLATSIGVAAGAALKDSPDRENFRRCALKGESCSAGESVSALNFEVTNCRNGLGLLSASLLLFQTAEIKRRKDLRRENDALRAQLARRRTA